MSTIEEKIAHLLRRALDQVDTPEGQTSRRLAEELMARHNVHVLLEPDAPPRFERRLGEVVERESPWRDVLASCACMGFGTTKMWVVYDDRFLLWFGGEPRDLDRTLAFYGRLRDLVQSVEIPTSVTVPMGMAMGMGDPWGRPARARIHTIALFLVENDFRLGLAQGLSQKLAQVMQVNGRESQRPPSQDGLEIHELDPEVHDPDPVAGEDEDLGPDTTALALRTHRASRYTSRPPDPPVFQPRQIQIDRESYQRGAMAAAAVSLRDLLEELCATEPK